MAAVGCATGTKLIVYLHLLHFNFLGNFSPPAVAVAAAAVALHLLIEPSPSVCLSQSRQVGKVFAKNCGIAFEIAYSIMS